MASLSPRVLSALSGLLAAAVALATGEFVAGLVRDVQSPFDAVGAEFIDRTPRWLKDFAISSFGTNDKVALRWGMLIVIGLLAMAVGVWSAKRPWIGIVAFVGFGIVGAVVAVQRPDGRGLDALPAIAAAIVGTITLLWLLARIYTPAPAEATDSDPRADIAVVDTVDTMRNRLMSTNRKASFDRRGFFVAGGAVLFVVAASGGVGRLLRRRFDASESRRNVVLPSPDSPEPPIPPGAQADVARVSPYVTPNADFYRIDTAFVTPQVQADDWRLRVHGLVERELELTYADLLSRNVVERTITIACVSNEVGGDLIGNATWLGVPIADILDEAGVLPEADQLKSTSDDGWTCGTPVAALTDGRDAILAFGMNGQPLPIAHGFPVRMVVPGLYGYVSATKWLVDMELTTFDAFDAYWIERGWAREGPIKTESRIDTPRSGATVSRGRVPIAGVAWAPHLGIEAVEVRIDEGPWQPAELAAEPTIDSWRQWVHMWDAEPGRHLVEVRATDGTGTPQTAEQAPPFPDGASGYHAIAVEVT